MSKNSRLNFSTGSGLVFPLFFLGVVVWFTKDVARSMLITPWTDALAGNSSFAQPIIVTVFALVFLSVPIGMMIRSVRKLRTSNEAQSAGRLQAALAAAPPVVQAMGYRSAPTGDALARYRPTLSVLPLPALTTTHGKNLPFALSTTVAGAKKRPKKNLVIGIGMLALLVPWTFAGTGESAGGLFVSLPILAVSIAILWPWIRPLLSGALRDPTVEIDREYVVAGQPFRVFVLQPGPARVVRFNVQLVCTEHVTYTQGTNTYHDDHLVCSLPLGEEIGLEIAKGQPFTRTYDALVPADSMHSFHASNNQIDWGIRVEAEIDNWPDVKQTFTVGVLPAS